MGFIVRDSDLVIEEELVENVLMEEIEKESSVK